MTDQVFALVLKKNLLQNRLHELVTQEQRTLTDPLVLRISRNLDEVIVDLQRRKMAG